MQERPDALVSIIIPVWNGRQDLPACMRALNLQTGVDFEVIVVDNASGDGSADYIATHFPEVHLLRNIANLGFAGGCNVGLHKARGSVFVLLNQDTEVQPDWLIRLITPLQQDPTIGITGSKALFPDGAIQHAGAHLDHQAISHHYGYAEQDRGEHDHLRDVDFVTGAALAISRRAYKAVGNLDKGFSPAYYEDTDWCYRVRLAGFRVVYVPDSVIIHKETSAALDQNYDGLYLLHRNRLRFVLKHFSMAKLYGEFLPAEQRWLYNLGWKGELIVAAMHHAMLYQLLHLTDLINVREQQLGHAGEEADKLAELLLVLRSIYPLRPANLQNASPDPSTSSLSSRPATYWSNLLHSVRRRWPSLSTAGMARWTAQLTNQQHLAEVLIEYIRENNREIADLAQEVQDLKRQLAQRDHSMSTDDKDS